MLSFLRSLPLKTSIALGLSLAACGSEPAAEEPSTRVDLRAMLGVDEATPIAITVAPDSGRRFLFDRNAGIFELESEGRASLLMRTSELPDPGTEVRLPYTDLVALGSDQFALTAIGDGFLLNTEDRTMRLHFCYEPAFLPEDFVQRTDAVAYDPAANKILAQPRTFNLEGDVVRSDIGFYNRDTGSDERWYELASDFAAAGMAVDTTGDVLLGRGTALYRYDRSAERVVWVDDLARFGVESIDGLAVDPRHGSLLVVDDQRNEFVEIPDAQLVH